jgi:hypothetical protein
VQAFFAPVLFVPLYNSVHGKIYIDALYIYLRKYFQQLYPIHFRVNIDLPETGDIINPLYKYIPAYKLSTKLYAYG